MLAEVAGSDVPPTVIVQCGQFFCSGLERPATVTVGVMLPVDDIFFPTYLSSNVTVRHHVPTVPEIAAGPGHVCRPSRHCVRRCHDRQPRHVRSPWLDARLGRGGHVHAVEPPVRAGRFDQRVPGPFVVPVQGAGRLLHDRQFPRGAGHQLHDPGTGRQPLAFHFGRLRRAVSSLRAVRSVRFGAGRLRQRLRRRPAGSRRAAPRLRQHRRRRCLRTAVPGLAVVRQLPGTVWRVPGGRVRDHGRDPATGQCRAGAAAGGPAGRRPVPAGLVRAPARGPRMTSAPLTQPHRPGAPMRHPLPALLFAAAAFLAHTGMARADVLAGDHVTFDTGRQTGIGVAGDTFTLSDVPFTQDGPGFYFNEWLFELKAADGYYMTGNFHVAMEVRYTIPEPFESRSLSIAQAYVVLWPPCAPCGTIPGNVVRGHGGDPAADQYRARAAAGSPAGRRVRAARAAETARAPALRRSWRRVSAQLEPQQVHGRDRHLAQLRQLGLAAEIGPRLAVEVDRRIRAQRQHRHRERLRQPVAEAAQADLPAVAAVIPVVQHVHTRVQAADIAHEIDAEQGVVEARQLGRRHGHLPRGGRAKGFRPRFLGRPGLAADEHRRHRLRRAQRRHGGRHLPRGHRGRICLKNAVRALLHCNGGAAGGSGGRRAQRGKHGHAKRVAAHRPQLQLAVLIDHQLLLAQQQPAFAGHVGNRQLFGLVGGQHHHPHRPALATGDGDGSVHAGCQVIHDQLAVARGHARAARLHLPAGGRIERQFHGNAPVRGKHVHHAVRSQVQARQRLRSGRSQHHAVEVEVIRPDEIVAVGNVHGRAREGQRAGGQRHLEAHARVRGHRVLAHVVVDEQEAAVAIAAHGVARRVQVGRVARHDGGFAHRHRGQARAEILQEPVIRAQAREHLALLAVRAQRRLEIVIDQRQVVMAARARAFLQPRAPCRIAPAMEHIIAQQVDARTELHRNHRRHVVGADHGAAAVHERHAGTVFGAEERRPVDLVVGRAPAAGSRLRTQVAAHAGVEPERIGFLGRQFARAGRPRFVDIAAEHGRHRTGRVHGAVPACHRVQRRVEPGLEGQPLERGDVFGALAGTAQIVFVFQLHADHGPAVLEHQPLQLPADLAVQARHVMQVLGIVAARGHAVHHPVRHAAEAHFRVGPRADAHHRLQSHLSAQLQEAAQVAAVGPVELAGLFLVVVPDDVAGHHGDAGRLHLAQRQFPVCGRRARVVEFAHHGEPRLAVARQIPAVGVQALAARRHGRPLLQVPEHRCGHRRAGVDAKHGIGVRQLLIWHGHRRNWHGWCASAVRDASDAGEARDTRAAATAAPAGRRLAARAGGRRGRPLAGGPGRRHGRVQQREVRGKRAVQVVHALVDGGVAHLGGQAFGGGDNAVRRSAAAPVERGGLLAHVGQELADQGMVAPVPGSRGGQPPAHLVFEGADGKKQALARRTELVARGVVGIGECRAMFHTRQTRYQDDVAARLRFSRKVPTRKPRCRQSPGTRLPGPGFPAPAPGHARRRRPGPAALARPAARRPVRGGVLARPVRHAAQHVGQRAAGALAAGGGRHRGRHRRGLAQFPARHGLRVAGRRPAGDCLPDCRGAAVFHRTAVADLPAGGAGAVHGADRQHGRHGGAAGVRRDPVPGRLHRRHRAGAGRAGGRAGRPLGDPEREFPAGGCAADSVVHVSAARPRRRTDAPTGHACRKPRQRNPLPADAGSADRHAARARSGLARVAGALCRIAGRAAGGGGLEPAQERFPGHDQPRGAHPAGRGDRHVALGAEGPRPGAAHGREAAHQPEQRRRHFAAARPRPGAAGMVARRSHADPPGGRQPGGQRHQRHRHRGGRAGPAVPEIRTGRRGHRPQIRRRRAGPGHLQEHRCRHGRAYRSEQRTGRGQRVPRAPAAVARGAGGRGSGTAAPSAHRPPGRAVRGGRQHQPDHPARAAGRDGPRRHHRPRRPGGARAAGGAGLRPGDHGRAHAAHGRHGGAAAAARRHGRRARSGRAGDRPDGQRHGRGAPALPGRRRQRLPGQADRRSHAACGNRAPAGSAAGAGQAAGAPAAPAGASAGGSRGGAAPAGGGGAGARRPRRCGSGAGRAQPDGRRRLPGRGRRLCALRPHRAAGRRRRAGRRTAAAGRAQGRAGAGAGGHGARRAGKRVSVCACERMRVCGHAGRRVCAYAGMRVGAYERMRVCGHAGMRVAILRRLAAQILARCAHLAAQRGGRMPRPARVVQHGARQRHQVSVAVGDDGLGVQRLGNQAHGHDRDTDHLLDGARQRHLVAGTDGNLLVRMQAAAGDVDHVDAALLEHFTHRLRLLDGKAARHPVGGRDAHADRAVGRKRGAHGVEHLERKAGAVFQRAAVFVGAQVRQRREELVQQVAVRGMDLDGVDADVRRPARRCREAVADAAQAVLVERGGRHVVVADRHGGRRDRLPAVRLAGGDLQTALPRPLHRRLAARVVQLHRNRHGRPAPHRFQRAAHGGGRGVVVQAHVGMADAPFRQHGRRFDGEQRGARLRQLAQVHLVPVVHAAVGGRVLAHRRDHDAVLQREIADVQRCKQLWGRHGVSYRAELAGLASGSAGRHDQFLARADHVHQHRAVVRQRGAHCAVEVVRVFHPDALDAHRLGHGGEIRVLQVAAGIGITVGLHFQFHEAQRAVVEHDDLDGQVQLQQRDELAHHHGKAAVAGKGYHLPVRVRHLRADGVQHGVGHRAVVERPHQPPPAVQFQVTRGPGNRRAHVAGKDGVVSGQLADDAGHGLRVDAARVRIHHGQAVEILAGLHVIVAGAFEEAAVALGGQLGQHGGQGLPHAPEQSQRERAAVAQRLGPHVDLDDARMLGEKLAVRKIGAQDHQRVAPLHGLVAGRESHQPGHAHVVRVVVFDVFLAAQRVHDGRLQRAGQCQHLGVGARAAGAAEQGHPLGTVEDSRQLVHLVRLGQHGRQRGQQPLRRRGVQVPGGHVARHDDHGHAAPGHGNAHGAVQDLRQQRRVGHQLHVVAAFLEQALRVRGLEIIDADFRARNVRGYCEYRHAAALAVEQAVNQVQVAGTAAARAHGQLAGEVRIGAGCKGSAFLVAHVDPGDALLAAQRVRETIERIAHHAVDAPDARLGQGAGQILHTVRADTGADWVSRPKQAGGVLQSPIALIKRKYMKALVYNGPCDVQVKDMPDAKIEKPTDVLVRVTTTNICGSDLHMYEGRTSMETGRILGHENLGEVIEVGKAVDRIKVGDMVCLPFNIGCGFCENCERGYSGFCLTANPGTAGAAYGFAGMGPYSGGQAELLRVPYADYNCLVLPEDAKEKENDYVMLSDILPTGYHATELAGVKPGETVVIYGAGPVGLMATMSAFIKGASQRRGRSRRAKSARPDRRQGHRPRLRMRGLPVLRPPRQGSAEPHHEQPGQGRQADRRHRRGGRVPARRSGRQGRPGKRRQARFRLRQFLVQGPEDRHWPGQRQALQPPAGQPDPRGQGQAVGDHLARTGAGRSAKSVREIRQTRRRLDQDPAHTGPAAPTQESGRRAAAPCTAARRTGAAPTRAAPPRGRAATCTRPSALPPARRAPAVRGNGALRSNTSSTTRWSAWTSTASAGQAHGRVVERIRQRLRPRALQMLVSTLLVAPRLHPLQVRMFAVGQRRRRRRQHRVGERRDMDAAQRRRVLERHAGGDAGADVGAGRNEGRIAEPFRHQPVKQVHGVHLVGCARSVRIPETGQGRNDDIERIGLRAAMPCRIAEQVRQVRVLDKTRRPAIEQQQRLRSLATAPDMQEVKLETVDVGLEVRQRGQARAGRVPVVAVGPIADQGAQRFAGRALAPAGDHLVGPARGGQPAPQVGSTSNTRCGRCNRERRACGASSGGILRQPFVDPRVHAPSRLRGHARGKAYKAVRRGGQQVAFHRGVGAPACGHQCGVVAQRIALPRAQEGRRHASQIAVQRRPRRLAALGVGHAGREQAQRIAQRGSMQHQRVGAGLAHGGRAGQIVHAVIQDGAGNAGQQVGPGLEAQQRGRRQVAACRFTDHVHGQAGKLRQPAAEQPARRGQAVVHDGVQRRVGGQPVVDRHHGHVAGRDQFGIELVVHGGIADGPAAAVKIEHHRARRPCAAQDAHGHLHTVGLRQAPIRADARPGQLAVGAPLRQPQQRLHQEWGDAVADPEARRPGQLAVEGARLVQRGSVEQQVRARTHGAGSSLRQLVASTRSITARGTLRTSKKAAALRWP
uniref:Alcohol dehydrogenase-like N-terminal domain-containing protein n=1 Tax=Tanacetum cinerariifolium TaxID=118510 RepID=A0A699GFG4_TANCI|nr:hypothetical protein [Tanacetum cinerariifolium]